MNAIDDNFSLQSAASQSAPKPVQKHPYFLVLLEPLSLEITQACDILSQGTYLNGPKAYEVILYGPGCKDHIQAKISRTYVRKAVSVDHTSYFYQVNCSVKPGQEYSVYLPKFF